MNLAQEELGILIVILRKKIINRQNIVICHLLGKGIIKPTTRAMPVIIVIKLMGM